jgi:hypothetical protein
MSCVWRTAAGAATLSAGGVRNAPSGGEPVKAPTGRDAFGNNPFGQQSPIIGASPTPPPKRAANTLATLSLVFAFLFAPVGAVLGHLGLSQIRRTGQRGRERGADRNHTVLHRDCHRGRGVGRVGCDRRAIEADRHRDTANIVDGHRKRAEHDQFGVALDEFGAAASAAAGSDPGDR